MKAKKIREEIIKLEEQMKDLIQSKKMSGTEFSARAGVNDSWIYPWSKGQRKIKYETVLEMAERLGL